MSLMRISAASFMCWLAISRARSPSWLLIANVGLDEVFNPKLREQ